MEYIYLRYFSIPFSTKISTEKNFISIFEPENKLTVMASVEFVSLYERKYLRDGKPSWKFLDEQLRKLPCVFAMRRFSPLFEQVKNILQKLIEGGFLDHKMNAVKGSVEYKLERTSNEVPALVLNVNDLAIGFLLCSIPLSLSVFAFFFELSLPIMIFLAMKTRDLIIYLEVIRILAKIRTS